MSIIFNMYTYLIGAAGEKGERGKRGPKGNMDNIIVKRNFQNNVFRTINSYWIKVNKVCENSNF